MQGRVPRLTVLHLNEKTSLSTGSVIQMLLAARQQAEDGLSVHVGTRPSEAIRNLVEPDGIGYIGLPLRHELDLGTVTALRSHIERIQPDVIHVHKGKAHTLALFALTANPGPSLIVNRGVSFPLNWMNRGKYRSERVARIVTVCEAIREVVVNTGKVAPSKVQVIHAGTDTNRFDPSSVDRSRFRREIGLDDRSFLFTHSGIRPWKGFRETIRAFARVRRRYPWTRLAFVGFDGEHHLENLRREIAESGLEESSFVLGHRSDMEYVLAGSDAIVDSSWAGTGITGTVREGMAMARPIIATRCGGNAELVSSDDLGWLVEPKDIDGLYAAMTEVIESPERARAVGRLARDHVVANFSMKRRAHRLGTLYREVQRRGIISTPVRQATADRSY